MKDKIIKCKEGNVNFITTIIWLIFLLPIGALAIYIGLSFRYYEMEYFVMTAFLAPIAIIGYYFILRRIINNIKLRRKGDIVRAVVKGYEKDNMEINEQQAYLIRLFVHNESGPEIIYYRTWDNKKRYDVDSEIELYKYKNSYLIKDEKKNKRGKIIVIISLLLIISINLFALYKGCTPYIDMLKLRYIDKTHTELRSNLNSLEYEIPDGFKLYSYRSNDNYSFASETDKHHCTISFHLWLWGSKDNGCTGGTSEEIINNESWCTLYYTNNETRFSKAYKKIMNNYLYSVDFNSYQDDDEFCSISLERLERSIKINRK